MANNQQIRKQINPSFGFVVDVDDERQAAFTECTLPNIEWDVEELKELFEGLRTKEEQLTSMYPQVTDDKLLELLFQIASELVSISTAKYDMTIPSPWIPETMVYREFNVDEVQEKLDKISDIFRVANHRIEELLSGYD